MSQNPDLLAIASVVLVALAVVWANPARVINRLFCTVALHVSLWLLCVHFAVVNGEDPTWIRRASIIGAFMPPHMWFLKEASLAKGALWQRVRGRVFFWFGASVLLAALCFSERFIQGPVIPGKAPNFGPAYFGFVAGFVGMFAMLCRETLRQIRIESGAVRLELQIMLLGGSATAIAIIFLMALRAILGALWPIHVQFVAVVVFYIGTVIAISTHRVFDARQILMVAMQKFILVAAAAGVALAVDRALVLGGLPTPVALFVTVAAVMWFAAVLNRWLDRVFHFYPEANAARQAAFAAARESRIDLLEKAFFSLLKGWGQTERVLILSGAQDALSGNGVEVERPEALLATMRHLRWATPERLGRERTTPQRQEVAAFLEKHHLGALVIGEGPTLTVLIGVGVGTARLPFTYPQVMQLIDLASIVESAYERAHLSMKAQHAEQLATVGLLGASLAHEIRNPLVSIKTFVQLLPHHHQDSAFREKFFRLIGEEVTRIDLLTEQLMDLASPRVYSAEMIDLHPVLHASLELVAAKANHKNIQFLTELHASPDRAFTDASAAKQVVLNLCFNAIQAIESVKTDGERWVKIATRNTSSGIEMAVADSGPGVDPEVRPRLFQPFQTTKSTGFGLGLAICSDILANLNASITVDPPAPGRGATFRVTFPCQPLSS